MRQVVGVGGKRKVDIYGWLGTEYALASGKNGLIECVPQVAYDVVGKSAEFFRRFFDEAHLNQLISRLRIHLTDQGGDFRIIGEGGFEGYEFIKVFSRPVEQHPRTVE